MKIKKLTPTCNDLFKTVQRGWFSNYLGDALIMVNATNLKKEYIKLYLRPKLCNIAEEMLNQRIQEDIEECIEGHFYRYAYKGVI